MADAAAPGSVAPRRRRHWFRWLLIVLVALVLLVRFGGVALLPKLVEEQAAKAGLAVTWQRLDLGLIAGRVELSRVLVRSLEDPSAPPILRLDYLLVDASPLSLLFGPPHVERVSIDGFYAGVTRAAEGSITLDGLRPMAKPAESDPQPPVAAAKSADAPLDRRLPFRLDEMHVHDVHLHVHDLTAEPAIESDVALDLSAFDLGAQRRAGNAELRLTAPGIVDAFELEAALDERGAQTACNWKLSARGVSTDLIEHVARDAGLSARSHQIDVELQGRVAVAEADGGALSGRLDVERLEVAADSEPELQASAHVELARLARNAVDVAKAQIELKGRATRLADGGWSALGVAIAPTPAPVPESKSPAEPFRLHVGELRPTVAFHYRDEQAAPPREVELALRDTVVKELAIGPGSADAPLEFDVHAKAGGAAVALSGSARPFREEREATIALRLEGVDALLKRLGVEAEVPGGTFDAHLAVKARVQDDGVTGSVELSQLRLAAGERELARLAALKVAALAIDGGGIHADRVELAEPFATVARNADRSWLIAGFKIPAPKPEPKSAPNAAPNAATEPATDAAASAPTPAAPEAAPPPAPPPYRISVGEFEMTGGRFAWRDRAVEPTVESNVALVAKVDGFDLGGHAPLKFDVKVRVDDAVEELAIAGTAATDPDHLALEVDFAGSSRAAGTLAPYVPKRRELHWQDGKIHLHASAALERSSEKGRSARLEVTDFALQDAGQEEPQVSFARLAVVAPQVDADAGPIVLTELALEKLEVALPPATSFGLATEGDEPLSLKLDLHNRAPVTLWSRDVEKLPPLDVDITARAPRLARELTIGIEAAPFASRPSLEVELNAKGLTSESLDRLFRALGQPLEAPGFTDGSFTAKFGVALDVQRREPLAFDFRSGFGGTAWVHSLALRAAPDAQPVAGVDSIEVEVASVRPATGDVTIRSIDVEKPAGLIRQTADGLEFGGLRLKAAPEPAAAAAGTPPDAPREPEAPAASANGAARKPELRVDQFTIAGADVRFVDETVEPAFSLPITDLDVEVKRFTTRALTEPRPIQVRATVVAGGIELTQRDTRSALSATFASAAKLVGVSPKVVMERRPAWDTIDLVAQLTLVPPRTGWARLEVRALELQMLKARAKAAGVDLEDGVVDSSIDVRAHGAEGVDFDSHTTFSWLRVEEPSNGPISRWLRLRVPLDTVLFLLRDSEGQQQVPLRFSVPPGGIARGDVQKAATEALVRLVAKAIESAPMRVVSGAIDSVQLSQVPGFDQIPGIDSLPGLKDIPGLNRLLGQKPEEDIASEPMIVELAPGSTQLPPDVATQLQPLIERLRKDDSVAVTVWQELGSGDRARFEKLGRPKPEDLVQLGGQLRRRRDELLVRHEAIAAEARGAFAVGRIDAATTALEHLRETDREIATAEQAIDQVYSLQGDRTPREDERLVRRAAAAIAEQRLQEMRDFLLALDIPDIGVRVDLRPPRASAMIDAPNSRIVLQLRRR